MTPEERKAARDFLTDIGSSDAWRQAGEFITKALDALDERDRLLRDSLPLLEECERIGVSLTDQKLIDQIRAILGGE